MVNILYIRDILIWLALIAYWIFAIVVFCQGFTWIGLIGLGTVLAICILCLIYHIWSAIQESKEWEEDDE